MKFLITIALTLLVVCECNVLNGRDEKLEQLRESDSEQNRDLNMNKIIGFKQFEEWLRLLQSQMTRLTDQFNRLLTPRESRLSNKDLVAVKETVQEMDNAINQLNVYLGRDAGALLADQNRDFSVSRVPFLEQIEEMLRLVQKQITDVSSTVTRALTGGLDLKGTAAEEMNKDANGISLSQVPFLKEFEEYLELFQKQINRFGGTVQRIIQGGAGAQQAQQVKEHRDV